VLELVVGQRLGLAVIALGYRFEKWLAGVVVGKPLLDDRPADRSAIFERCQLVAHRGRIRPVAAKRASFFAAVGMAKDQPVTRRARLDSCTVHLVHQPVAAAEQHDRPQHERVATRVPVRLFPRGAVVHDKRVRERHDQDGS
jgi:hypothetical protein